MIEKSATELSLFRSKDPLPTVEVDLGSISEELLGYDDLVAQAIQPFANSLPDLRATIYVYQGSSVNFHEKTFSAFFCIAGQKKQELLDLLLHSFRRIPGVKVKNSEYIDASTGLAEFHIESGVVWCPLDAATWYSKTQYLKNEEKNEGGDMTDNNELIHDEGHGRNPSPLRFRAARSDTTVGVIRAKMEEIFGLPEGSVALCHPDGKHMRSDARISTLRDSWDY